MLSWVRTSYPFQYQVTTPFQPLAFWYLYLCVFFFSLQSIYHHIKNVKLLIHLLSNFLQQSVLYKTAGCLLCSLLQFHAWKGMQFISEWMNEWTKKQWWQGSQEEVSRQREIANSTNTKSLGYIRGEKFPLTLAIKILVSVGGNVSKKWYLAGDWAGSWCGSTKHRQLL